jgi:hypothetical protein
MKLEPLQNNMNIVGPITYTPEELAFADKIMKDGMEAKA